MHSEVIQFAMAATHHSPFSSDETRSIEMRSDRGHEVRWGGMRRVMGNLRNTHGYYTVYSTSTYTNHFCAVCDCAISTTTGGTKNCIFSTQYLLVWILTWTVATIWYIENVVIIAFYVVNDKNDPIYHYFKEHDNETIGLQTGWAKACVISVPYRCNCSR